MYKVYEVFSDGKRYLLFEHEDAFEVEVWEYNHLECTQALRTGKSHLEIVAE